MFFTVSRSEILNSKQEVVPLTPVDINIGYFWFVEIRAFK